MYAYIEQESHKVVGSIERVTFHNPENGYSVLKVVADSNKKKPIIVTVNLPAITIGERIECYGDWIVHPKFGEQFKAARAVVKPPIHKKAIEKYLSSGVISGIGEAYAYKLVKVFGDKTLEALEKASKDSDDSIPSVSVQQALEVKGKAWENIKAGIAKYLETYKQYERERLWLTDLGLGPMSIQKLLKAFGDNTIPIIKKNPYILIEKIKGFGFLKSDDVALRLGVPKDSSFRIKAGLIHAIKENNSEGHCYIEINQLLEEAETLLELDSNICFEQLKELVADDELRYLKINVSKVVGLTHFYQHEEAIANKIKRLCSMNLCELPHQTIIETIRSFEEKTHWTLNEQQVAAITTALTKRCLIVTGGPGTGKTTITRCISMALANVSGHRLMGCSPTGRAAKRLSESLNVDNGPKIECSSIHRLLEARISSGDKHYFNRTAHNPIEAGTLIVDEMSMVDVSLFYHLLHALPAHARLIMIGDVDQLPSVGPGRVLADLIDSEVIPVVRLIEVQRQAATSRIISNAHRINQGLMPLLEDDNEPAQDFFFIEEGEPKVIRDKIVELICDTIPNNFKKGEDKPYNPLLDVQVLSPMKNSVIGVNALNEALQEALNPYGVNNDQGIKQGDYFIYPGDKVIQLQNNYDKQVFNGDIGFVQRIDKQEGIVEVLFFGNELITALYKIHELDQLSLAYATTIHKAQGSEYPIIIMPVSTQHYIMLQRNLLYTGATRGKKLVFLIGQAEALNIAVNNDKTAMRITNLKQRLMN